jgi:hypothetical protein
VVTVANQVTVVNQVTVANPLSQDENMIQRRCDRIGLRQAAIACGGLLLLTSCSAKTTAPPQAATPSAATVAVFPQSFPLPTVGQLKPDELPLLPIKGLTPATAAKNRLQQVAKGATNDPFAPTSGGVDVVPIVPSGPPVTAPVSGTGGKPRLVRAATKSAGAIAAKAKTNPIRAIRYNPVRSNLGGATVAAIPAFRQPVSPIVMPNPTRYQPATSLPVVPLASPVATQPPVASPSAVTAPLPSATALADAIEITGVMGQSVIIKSPNENSARYVTAGSRIGGGVSVKSVNISAVGEPVVVLEQNGVAVTKTIGSSGPSMARR